MRKNRLPKFIIAAMTSTLLLLALLFFISYQPEWRLKAATLPSSALSHMSQLWQKPFGVFEETRKEVVTLLNTYRENQSLKAHLSELRNQNSLIQSLEAENQGLRQQLNIREAYPKLKTIPANILVRSSVAWLDQVTIDKGSQDQVTESMLLVSEAGLVGHITLLGPETSQVQLLTNTVSSAAIPVIIEGKEAVYGILMGYDSEKKAVKIGQLNSQAEVVSGSLVKTSGLDGEGPSGIAVGKVVEVVRDKDQSRVIYVSLDADLTELTGVSLVGRGS